jgi:hypothetical protein
MKTQQRSSLIPDQPPPPELAAAVRSALGLDKEPAPPKPTMADALPDGLSDAGKPLEGLKLPDPPPPRPIDETIPAFGPITRVNLADLAHMGWLSTRLVLRFPHIQEGQWLGRLRMYMMDNAYLFVKSGEAAALATVVRDAFRSKPHVSLLFCMHAEASKPTKERESAERDCVLLLREVVRWAKTLGAGEVGGLTDFCDLSPTALIHDLAGSEKREEIVVKIRGGL